MASRSHSHQQRSLDEHEQKLQERLQVPSIYYVRTFSGISDPLPPNVSIDIRVRPRFFDQVGHETMYSSSGNKHFSLNLVIVILTKIMNRADKHWAQF